MMSLALLEQSLQHFFFKLNNNNNPVFTKEIESPFKIIFAPTVHVTNPICLARSQGWFIIWVLKQLTVYSTYAIPPALSQEEIKVCRGVFLAQTKGNLCGQVCQPIGRVPAELHGLPKYGWFLLSGYNCFLQWGENSLLWLLKLILLTSLMQSSACAGRR